eukprot:6473007-Pyramimonas_sp.AAC.1
MLGRHDSSLMSNMTMPVFDPGLMYTYDMSSSVGPEHWQNVDLECGMDAQSPIDLPPLPEGLANMTANSGDVL